MKINNKSKRVCPVCHKTGITVTFDTGNALKKHIKVRHPQISQTRGERTSQLRKYRKELLLQREKFFMKDY